MSAGTVAEVWRYPVKSLRGEAVEGIAIDARGVGGDRAHMLLEHRKGGWQRLTATQAPRLLDWAAAYPDAPGTALDPGDPPAATLTAPDGQRYAWGADGLARRLEDDLGREIRLRRAPGEQHDVPGTVHVTFEASRASAEAILERPLDVRRFRTNLHLELDAPPWAEEGWTGAELRFDGGVVLIIDHPCERCVVPTRDPDAPADRWPTLLKWLDAEHATNFGVRARVRTPGTVRRGECVSVLSSAF